MTVSVVMSTYNDAAYLAESIESVLSQDFADFEFVIVNDGSPDPRTAEILTRYSTLDPRIRVVTTQNAGLTRALIDGCAVAPGAYVARLDVGDVMTPERLRRQAEVLDQRPDVSFVSCWTEFCGPEWEHLWTEKGSAHKAGTPECRMPNVECRMTKGDGEEPGAGSPNPTSDLRPPTSTVPAVWAANVLPDTPGENLKAGPTHHGSVMMRRHAYEAAGGYRWQFYYGQDWDLWYRLAEQGLFAVVPEVLYRVRLLPGGISAHNSSRQEVIGRCSLEAFTLRRQCLDQSPALERAAAIRPQNGRHRPPWTWERAGGWYFLGATLYRTRDPRCRNYLRRALRTCPYHLKAWVLLGLSLRLR